MATLDEISKSFADNPVFKALSSLPLASITMPPGMVAIQKAGEQIAALAGHNKDLSALINPMQHLQGQITDFNKAVERLGVNHKSISDHLAQSVVGPTAEMQRILALASKQVALPVLTPPKLVIPPRIPPVRQLLPRPTHTSRQIAQAIERMIAPSESAAPAAPSLLPPGVEQSRKHIAALITELKTLPPPDIITVLDWNFSQQKGNTSELFLDRLAHYLADGKDFSPTCWQIVKFWLNSRRASAPPPTWHYSVATDAAATPTQIADTNAGVSRPPVEENRLTPLQRPARTLNWIAILLPPLNKHSLYSILTSLELLTPAGELTDLGRGAAPRIWAGVVAALREKNYILHDYSATHKVLTAELGIKLGVRSLNPAQGLPVEAENIKRATLNALRQVLG